MSQQDYKVGEKSPLGLFIRSEPLLKDSPKTKIESTKIAVLPMGQKVKKLAESDIPKWWKVSTKIQGSDITGFVNSGYLTAVETYVEPAEIKRISRVDLQSGGSVTRKNKAWAYALNENKQPTRDLTGSVDEKVKTLTKIVEWLDVANLHHLRYKRIPNATYCNIYAYDYCYLANVYLPRVWWTSKVLIDLDKGKNVIPIYGQTVNEINANSLFVWLKDFGPLFGWKRTTSFDEMQNAANNGQAAIVCAQNKIPNKSGHICAVVPETASNKAVRKNGTVIKPLQSQAGATNHMYWTDLWWIRLASTFREHGFWINAA
jgi:hypothetical protein